MGRSLAIAAVLAAAVPLAGCGGADRAAPKPARPAATRLTAHGLTVALPAGWRAARTNLTPHLVDPREQLSVATFPLRYRDTQCAQFPGSALADLGPRDALVTVQEVGEGRAVLFPARPARLQDIDGAVTLSEVHACTPGGGRYADRWLSFSDGGRNFYALVAIGPSATAATRRAAWRILNGLRVDPTVRPTWPSA